MNGAENFCTVFSKTGEDDGGKGGEGTYNGRNFSELLLFKCSGSSVCMVLVIKGRTEMTKNC